MNNGKQQFAYDTACNNARSFEGDYGERARIEVEETILEQNREPGVEVARNEWLISLEVDSHPGRIDTKAQLAGALRDLADRIEKEER